MVRGRGRRLNGVGRGEVNYFFLALKAKLHFHHLMLKEQHLRADELQTCAGRGEGKQVGGGGQIYFTLAEVFLCSPGPSDTRLLLQLQSQQPSLPAQGLWGSGLTGSPAPRPVSGFTNNQSKGKREAGDWLSDLGSWRRSTSASGLVVQINSLSLHPVAK